MCKRLRNGWALGIEQNHTLLLFFKQNDFKWRNYSYEFIFVALFYNMLNLPY